MVSIISPYAYHPHAPATADVLSTSLLQANFYMRNSARLVGVQTYQGALNIGAYYEAAAGAKIQTTGFVDIARFRRAKPTFYTHVKFIAFYRLFGTQAIHVEHRISAVDELANSETSASFEQDIQPVTADPGRLAPFDPSVAMVGSQFGTLDITSLTGSIGSFVVSAYARDDQEGRAEYYRPEQIVCWLDVEAAP